MARRKGRLVRRKLKATSIEKDGTLPPSDVWNPAQNFLAQCSKMDGTALRIFVVETHELVFGEGPKDRASTDMIKARLSSELQYRGFKDAGCVRLLSPRFLKNRRALRAWNLDALDSRLRNLIEEGEVMGKSTKKKTTRKSGGTITSFMVGIMRKRMGTNKEVISQVAKSFPDSKWATETAPSLLAWYKSQFQLGNITGQTKRETLDQPDTGRAAKKATAKKATSKKARKAGRKKVTRKTVKRSNKKK